VLGELVILGKHTENCWKRWPIQASKTDRCIRWRGRAKASCLEECLGSEDVPGTYKCRFPLLVISYLIQFNFNQSRALVSLLYWNLSL
jgi:hypothetical protein